LAVVGDQVVADSTGLASATCAPIVAGRVVADEFRVPKRVDCRAIEESEFELFTSY
jgi:hypothetical protein